ncbi:hypothetical protein H5410_027165 [Solanum commersonii]|uniref:Uncharacterized protein n=1 Tax=Solanum commersonii TaxID=4109 RepID=A0A9J5YYH3_SOLCO|nr:hypothetical protein H5410_027165 [Solanum commersonii]
MLNNQTNVIRNVLTDILDAVSCIDLAEKNAMFQQQQVRDQMLQSCPLQVTTPTIYPSFRCQTSALHPKQVDLARRNRGIYTFRVQGRMYHRIDNLYSSGNKAKNLQLYFYYQENELTNRMADLDQQLYNLPTSSEIAPIWVEENYNTISHAPHFQIYTHSNKTQIVNYYYGCYDALQYPLLFPHGQNGWHCGIN